MHGVVMLALISGLALACGGSGDDGDEAAVSAGAPHFFELLRDGYEASFSHVDDPREMAGYSDRVVVAEIAGLEAGGTVGGAHSSVARMHVSQSIRGGSSESTLYVELLHGVNTTAEELNAALPVPVGLWFLQDVESVVASGPLDEGRGKRGLPEGEVLWGPASNQGFVMEGGGGLEQPLEADRTQWFDDIASYRSLDEMIDVVAGAAAP